jgi:hypothetical protein
MPRPYGTKTRAAEAVRVANRQAKAAAKLAAATRATPKPSSGRTYTLRDPRTGKLCTFEVLN